MIKAMKTTIKIQFNDQIIELNRQPDRGDGHLIFSYRKNGQEYEIETYFNEAVDGERDFFLIKVMDYVRDNEGHSTPNFHFWCTCFLSDNKQELVTETICNPLSGEISKDVKSSFLIPIVNSVYEQLKPEILGLMNINEPEQGNDNFQTIKIVRLF